MIQENEKELTKEIEQAKRAVEILNDKISGQNMQGGFSDKLDRTRNLTRANGPHEFVIKSYKTPVHKSSSSKQIPSKLLIS